MRALRDRIERVSATDFTVLVGGAIDPEPHPDFVEVRGPAALRRAERQLAGAGEDGARALRPSSLKVRDAVMVLAKGAAITGTASRRP